MRGQRKPPELVVDGFPRRRPRWVELTTSANHKDVALVLMVAALGFLFIALIEMLLMRLQLAIPENTFLSPVTFNRMLSLYGATAVFLFAIPLVLGFFYLRFDASYVLRFPQVAAISQNLPWLFTFGVPGRYIHCWKNRS